MSKHSLIRWIGDKILHQPGKVFPSDYSQEDLLELERQIDIAKKRLIGAGGAGIAANQCKEIGNPYRFVIVGVFYTSDEHLNKVGLRYPQVQFPLAKVMVDPYIVAQSEDIQTFTHACLSLPCPNRADIASPQTMRVTYKDPFQGLKSVEAEFEGVAAVVLWHELNHILEGKTYLDTALSALSREDLKLFYTLLEKELAKRRPVVALESNAPLVSIAINQKGYSYLKPEVLMEVMAATNLDVLRGMMERVLLEMDLR